MKAGIDSAYPEIHLNWSTILTFCADLSAHKPNPSVLDVLTLSQVIRVMENCWDNRFCHYFRDVPGQTGWLPKLRLIKKVRNPMAHAQADFIDETELTACLHYCDDIIRMSY